MKKFLFLLSITILFSFTGCQKVEEVGDVEKIKVVTTFTPLYSLTANVGGDLIDLENLVPPGTSEHVWEPKPSDIKKIAEADLLIANGLELEMFLPDILSAANNENLKVIYVADDVNALNYSDIVELEEHDEEEEEHGHDGVDPHVWLSPVLAMDLVENIKAGLVQVDAKNVAAYEANAEVYVKKLVSLNEEIKAAFAEVEKQDFIVFHDAYQYYFREFGISENRRAAVEEFPGKEPSPAYLKKLVDLIEKEGVKIVFTEPQFSPKIVETLKSELGVTSYEIDPTGSEVSAEGYEKNLKLITETLVDAFKNTK